MYTELTRLVRMTLDSEPRQESRWTNNWVGGPTMDRLVPRVELEITVRRPVSRRTGYIEDITVLDRCLKHHAVRTAADAGAVPTTPADWLTRMWHTLHQGTHDLPGVVRLALRVTPHWSYAIHKEPTQVMLLTRQFEFSAAHRLHSADLSDDENRQFYGKCNNPYGHGHNYLLDVTIDCDLDSPDATSMSAERLDQLVNERVVSRLDHRFLNHEVDPFRTLNPTAEQIAETIWQWLDGLFAPHRLRRIRLYETAKTWVDIVSDE